MAFQLWKLVGGSKLLLLPMTGLALGGTAISYGTYTVARGWSGSALGVDFEKAGTLCKGVSSVGGLAAAGGFLFARHSNYRPLPFRTILEQMERELHGAGPSSVTRAVNASGTVVSSQQIHANPRPAASAPRLQGWMHDMRSRTRLFLRAARVPVRFYAVNILGVAVVAGCVTSVAQRLVCGRTGTQSEVGNIKQLRASQVTSAPTHKFPATIQEIEEEDNQDEQ